MSKSYNTSPLSHNKVTVSQYWVPTINEDQERDGFTAFNASGRGKEVCVIEGPIEVYTNKIGIDFARRTDGGGTWTIWQALSQAQKNIKGMSVVK